METVIVFSPGIEPLPVTIVATTVTTRLKMLISQGPLTPLRRLNTRIRVDPNTNAAKHICVIMQSGSHAI